MGNKVKINLYIDEEIDQKIEELAKATIRGKNDVITWLVTEEWKKHCVTVSAETPLVEVIEQPEGVG